MRGPGMIALALCLMLPPGVHGNESSGTKVNIVERFIAAFNAQDSSAMASLVDRDIEWLSIAGEQVVVEARGKQNLVESMNAYFESCPSCRSELTSVTSTSERVSAVEIASWQGENGRTSQSSISVYEFSEGRIRRVYYFSAENQTGDP